VTSRAAPDAGAPPLALAPNPDGIPAALRALPRWGNWMFTPDERKRPVVTAGGYWASKSKDEDWGPYDAAVEAYNRYLTSRNPYHGLYLLFTRDDGLLGIDSDHCIRPDGSIMPWALWIIEHIASYTELSVSGTGIHIVVEATPPWDNGQAYVTFHIALAHGAKVEIYYHTMGFAVTGVRPALPDCVSVAANVVANQAGVDALYAWLVQQHGADGRSRRPRRQGEAHQPANPSPSMTDDEVILRARYDPRYAPGRFDALFDHGDLSGQGGDHSAADFALCCRLAYWTQDVEQIDRIFRKSGLMRDKWDEVHFSDGATYGERTIENALADVSEHFSPPDGSETVGEERETGPGACVYQTIDLATGEHQVHRGGIVCRRGGRGAQWLP
jgi:putative DNA primase/helicase